MKYCIVYALTNMMADEKISVGMVCQTPSGWVYEYSDIKLKVALALFSGKEVDYVRNFVKEFWNDFLAGKSDEAILACLGNLHCTCNNYVIFSEVRDMVLKNPAGQKELIFNEFVEPRKLRGEARR